MVVGPQGPSRVERRQIYNRMQAADRKIERPLRFEVPRKHRGNTPVIRWIRWED